MIKYVVLLRGINVGGKRKILMADLRNLLEANAFKNVVTYIQSGNIILESRIKQAEKVATKIKNLIKKEYDYDVPTLARTTKEWADTFSKNPFLKKAGLEEKQLIVTFLAEEPSKENVQLLAEVKSGKDEFKIIGRSLYLHLGAAYTNTKLSNGRIEKKLKVQATTRNWRTVSKLHTLSSEN